MQTEGRCLGGQPCLAWAVRVRICRTRARQILSQLPFEFGHLRLELREFFARAREHFALHVVLLPRHEVETAEEAREQRTQVLLEIGRRALGEHGAEPFVDLIK